MKSRLAAILLWQGKSITYIAAIASMAMVSCSLLQPKPATPTSASISFNRSLYSSADEVYVTVEDADKNKSPTRVEAISVSLSVFGRDEPVRVKLTETDVNTGIFRNAKGLPLTVSPSKGTKRSIFAEGGDVIKVTYVDRNDPSDRREQQARVDGGRFSYKVDPSLKPSKRYVSGDTDRPIGAVINPDGIRDEFVINEIIVKTDDPAVLDDILKKYDGKILYGDITASAPEVSLRGELRPPPYLWGYNLVRVNPAKADLRYIVRKLAERDLTGHFVFSSEDALRIGAIIVAEKELGRNVTLNSIDTAYACPCDETREYTVPTTGNSDNAFDYQWFDTLGASPDTLDREYFGITKVWQLLNAMGIPHNIPSDWLPGYEWEPVHLGIIDGGFEPNDDWPGGVRPDWCYSFNGGFFLATPLGISTDCAGVNQLSCSSGPCPWHGTLVYGAAAALANNGFGAAGTAGSCNEPIVEVMLSERDETRFSLAADIGALILGGADIINISSGGNCGGWCRDHEYRSGRSMLSFAIDDATRRGILVVAAAGNDGNDLDEASRVQLSCEWEKVLCVSSINWHCNDPAANCFEHRDHNYGSNIDIWAPDSFKTWSPDDSNTTPPYTPAIERRPGGTSIATPYVSGVLALMKALYPPETRHTFNLAAARSLLRNTAHTDVSTSIRVNSYGGMINPWGMALSLLEDGHLDDHLVDFDIADIDDNEPEDPSQANMIDVRTGNIGNEETIEGIITTEADTDRYHFNLTEPYDVQLSLVEEVHPGEILLTGLGEPSATQLSTRLTEGIYNVQVVQDRSAERHPFNCYTLEYSGALATFDADVFDDEERSTPPGGPNHVWRNDRFLDPTSLQLHIDPQGEGISLRYEGLNFDSLDDQDHFRVRLPPRADTDCRQCRCGDHNFCSESLDITVDTPLAPVHIGFLYPDGTVPEGTDGILPQWPGWENTSPEATTRLIHIECPYDEYDASVTYRPAEYEGRSIVNDHQEIAFFIAPDLENPSRTEYDLTITFRPLDEDECVDLPFPWPRISRMIGSRIPDEPTPYYFPLVDASWDCHDIPGCDPAEEYVSMDWLGGDLTLAVEYFTLVRPGTPAIELVNAEGKVLASAKPSAATKPAPSHLGPRSYETYGRLNLDVKSLPKGHYFLKVDGPLPTYFLYKGGDNPK